jgi:mRNA interferase RelE/StbE
MRFEILLSPEAIQDLRALQANRRATARDAIEQHLRHSPAKESKSRIKRLRGLSRPQFRLRVSDLRIYYDVSENTVEILGIVAKSESEAWLERVGQS